MRRVMLVTVLMAGALFAFGPASARADEMNELTYFTFSGPVELPGTTLPAGTYMFIHPDVNDPHVLQVFSEDGKTLYGTYLTIPERRGEVSDDPIVVFNETATGNPEQIRAWFYPDRVIGDEFLYSPKQTSEQNS